jgi:hypothetical protein
LDERRIDAAQLCELVHLGKDDALLLSPEIVVIDRYVHAGGFTFASSEWSTAAGSATAPNEHVGIRPLNMAAALKDTIEVIFANMVFGRLTTPAAAPS